MQKVTLSILFNKHFFVHMDETYKIQSGYEKLIIIYTSDTRVPLYKTRVVRKQLINCTGIVIVIFDLRC